MRVAIYARVSTQGKKQENENQLRELSAFAERMGYTLYKKYIDEESGGRADRPAFQQLFLDAHQRRFDVVLFWALDRFSREGVTETLNHLQKLTATGVQFKSFTEQYLDSTGLFRDAIIAILAAIAKQERVRHGERTKSALARKKEAGMALGRPGTAASVQERIQQLRGEGKSVRAITAELQAAGIQISKSAVGKYC